MKIVYSGGKKRHHKEMIAEKRRERMIRRGVDLYQINLVGIAVILSLL